jgi:ADP-ribosylglycohydrolase
MGYTFKTLGAGFYALRQAINRSNASIAPQVNFRNSIEEIIWEGGDADTNAAVAGALVGAYLGAMAIPESWRRDLHPQDKAVLQEAMEHCEQVAQRILRK